jgi:hypothetical protein
MGPGEGHLPPGRAPGGLTKRTNGKQRRGIAFVVLLDIAAVFVVVAVVTASPAGSGSAIPAASLLCFAATALTFVAYSTYRAGRPRWARDLMLQVEPIEVRRGGELTATVTINQPAKPGSRLELTLCCTQFYDIERRTVRPPYWRYHVRESRVDFEQVYELDVRRPESTVRLRVPADGQLSYEGDQTCWAWAVDFRSRGKFGLRRASGAPIWVSAGPPGVPDAENSHLRPERLPDRG